MLIDIKTPNNLQLAYHRILSVNIDFDFGFGTIVVCSYASEDAFLQYSDPSGFSSKPPSAFTWSNIRIPVSEFLSGEDSLSDHLELLLVADTGSPFFGGQLLADNSGTLQALRERKWTEIKAARRAAERGNFIFEGGLYYADKEQITGSATAAFMSKSLGLPYNETWTLVDNTTRDLNADQVIALGLALRAFVSGVYARGRSLRTKISEAEIIDEVAAINWETPIG
jgi:hypothetical protein